MTTDTEHNDQPGTLRMALGVVAALGIVAAIFAWNQFQRAERLEGELTATMTTLKQTGDNLAQARIENSQLRDTVQTANDVLKEQAKRDLPVSIQFREAMFGRNLVAVFRNNSSEAIEVSAVFTSPTTGQKLERNLVIPGNGVQEFGEREGWPFVPGQHVELSNRNFRPAGGNVPNR